MIATLINIDSPAKTSLRQFISLKVGENWQKRIE
jgi:hypothetical protein